MSVFHRISADNLQALQSVLNGMQVLDHMRSQTGGLGQGPSPPPSSWCKKNFQS